MSAFTGEYVAHVKSELGRRSGGLPVPKPEDAARFSKGGRKPRADRAYRRYMARWEYMTLECASLDQLNHFGADGWELVGEIDVLLPDEEDAGSEIEQRVLLFKRPIPPPTT